MAYDNTKFNPSHFKKGVAMNPDGRPRGSVNTRPHIIQQHLFEVYLNNIPKLEVELGKLEGKQFIDEMLGIVGYLIPKGFVVANVNTNSEEKVVEIFRISGKEFTL